MSYEHASNSRQSRRCGCSQCSKRVHAWTSSLASQHTSSTSTNKQCSQMCCYIIQLWTCSSHFTLKNTPICILSMVLYWHRGCCRWGRSVTISATVPDRLVLSNVHRQWRERGVCPSVLPTYTMKDCIRSISRERNILNLGYG